MYPNTKLKKSKTAPQGQLEKDTDRLVALGFKRYDLALLTDGEVAAVATWLHRNVLSWFLAVSFAVAVTATYVSLLLSVPDELSQQEVTVRLVSGVISILSVLVLLILILSWLVRWLTEADRSLGVSVRALIKESRKSPGIGLRHLKQLPSGRSFHISHRFRRRLGASRLPGTGLRHLRQLARLSRMVQKRARRTGIDLETTASVDNKIQLHKVHFAVAASDLAPSLSLPRDARALVLGHVKGDFLASDRWKYQKWRTFLSAIPPKELSTIVTSVAVAFIVLIMTAAWNTLPPPKQILEFLKGSFV